MGKAPNGLGQFSGKIGGVVFAVSNGEQIVRAYQPVVSNPKSSAQMLQRAKGNLTGRISSFVPKTTIMGLGANNRMRRAEFLRQILKKATVTQSGGDYNAKIADSDVVFSKGTAQMGVVLDAITGTSTRINVSLSGVGTSEIEPEVYATMQTRLVVMIYDNTTQELIGVETKIANKPAQSATATTSIPIIVEGAYIAVVYAIPMATSDGSAVTITTDMAGKDDATIAALLSANRSNVIFTYGRSLVLGQYPTT